MGRVPTIAVSMKSWATSNHGRPIDVIARNRPSLVVAQGVVVVQVLVTQGQAVDPLSQHISQTVLNLARLPVVGQPPGKRCRQSQQAIRPAQQQNAAVARHMTSIEAGGYPAFTTGWKFQLIGVQSVTAKSLRLIISSN